MVSESISVVYVEDDPDLRELVEIIFARKAGMQIVALEPDPDVLEQVRKARPDIVMLDVMMPGIDGRTLASAMKTDPELATVPFVFMTAKARPQELEDLRGLGALGVISKPFDPLKLPDEVRRLLAKKQDSD